MKKVLLILLTLLYSTQMPAQEPGTKSAKKKGEVAGYASRDASALSVMGWGLALSVGIATLFSLLDNNASSSGHAH